MPSHKQAQRGHGHGSLSDSSTSRSLLARLRDDDSQAWDRLVSLYTPLVYFWCQKLNLPEQEIPDVVQEVYKAVHSNIDRFRKDRAQDTFRGWLRTITRSKVADHYRRCSRQPQASGGSVAHRRMAEVADVEDDGFDEEPVYNALFLRALELIRGEFQERTWQAFWRTTVDSQPANDVAEELSMRPGAVRVAKSRVLQRLRRELGESPD